MSLNTDRYVPLPIIATNKITGEVCQVYYVTDGDQWCNEGDLILHHDKHIDGSRPWSLLSTPNYAVYNSRDWAIEVKFKDGEAARAKS